MKSLSVYLMLLVLVIASCKKKRDPLPEHPVPYAPVEMTLFPNDPTNFKIQAIGGWMYFNGGVHGLIVYRKSNEEFVVLERCSPSDPNNEKAKAQMQPDNFTLRDTITGSQWQVFDGTVTKGPAEWPLRQYGASYNGNSLRIRN